MQQKQKSWSGSWSGGVNFKKITPELLAILQTKLLPLIPVARTLFDLNIKMYEKTNELMQQEEPDLLVLKVNSLCTSAVNFELEIAIENLFEPFFEIQKELHPQIELYNTIDSLSKEELELQKKINVIEEKLLGTLEKPNEEECQLMSNKILEISDDIRRNYLFPFDMLTTGPTTSAEKAYSIAVHALEDYAYNYRSKILELRKNK